MDLMSTGEISRDDVTNIRFDVMAAGSDTTAVTMEWAMALLLRNTGAMAKVRAEIDGALGGRESVTADSDVARLPFLQAW
ncbi:cytochrome P450 76M5-like [Panicum miliaceum]|uniref:Cytochrome P450 76M5-like n=1 Tax=Panicum miliaceum TaxID=4540 RepID=A0A3L6PQY1_PANMI|nr:cytochrome P450 76M5-like [Panicum miliaceum]